MASSLRLRVLRAIDSDAKIQMLLSDCPHLDVDLILRYCLLFPHLCPRIAPSASCGDDDDDDDESAIVPSGPEISVLSLIRYLAQGQGRFEGPDRNLVDEPSSKRHKQAAMDLWNVQSRTLAYEELKCLRGLVRSIHDEPWSILHETCCPRAELIGQAMRSPTSCLSPTLRYSMMALGWQAYCRQRCGPLSCGGGGGGVDYLEPRPCQGHIEFRPRYSSCVRSSSSSSSSIGGSFVVGVPIDCQSFLLRSSKHHNRVLRLVSETSVDGSSSSTVSDTTLHADMRYRFRCLAPTTTSGVRSLYCDETPALLTWASNSWPAGRDLRRGSWDEYRGRPLASLLFSRAFYLSYSRMIDYWLSSDDYWRGVAGHVRPFCLRKVYLTTTHSRSQLAYLLHDSMDADGQAVEQLISTRRGILSYRIDLEVTTPLRLSEGLVDPPVAGRDYDDRFKPRTSKRLRRLIRTAGLFASSSSSPDDGGWDDLAYEITLTLHRCTGHLDASSRTLSRVKVRSGFAPRLHLKFSPRLGILYYERRWGDPNDRPLSREHLPLVRYLATYELSTPTVQANAYWNEARRSIEIQWVELTSSHDGLSRGASHVRRTTFESGWYYSWSPSDMARHPMRLHSLPDDYDRSKAYHRHRRHLRSPPASGRKTDPHIGVVVVSPVQTPVVYDDRDVATSDHCYTCPWSGPSRDRLADAPDCWSIDRWRFLSAMGLVPGDHTPDPHRHQPLGADILARASELDDAHPEQATHLDSGSRRWKYRRYRAIVSRHGGSAMTGYLTPTVGPVDRDSPPSHSLTPKRKLYLDRTGYTGGGLYARPYPPLGPPFNERAPGEADVVTRWSDEHHPVASPYTVRREATDDPLAHHPWTFWDDGDRQGAEGADLARHEIRDAWPIGHIHLDITVGPRTDRHPTWTGDSYVSNVVPGTDNEHAFYVNGIESPVITLVEGATYLLTLRGAHGHSLYFTEDAQGGARDYVRLQTEDAESDISSRLWWPSQDTGAPRSSDGMWRRVLRDGRHIVLTPRRLMPIGPSKERSEIRTFYYQCSHSPSMGGLIVIERSPSEVRPGVVGIDYSAQRYLRSGPRYGVTDLGRPDSPSLSGDDGADYNAYRLPMLAEPDRRRLRRVLPPQGVGIEFDDDRPSTSATPAEYEAFFTGRSSSSSPTPSHLGGVKWTSLLQLRQKSQTVNVNVERKHQSAQLRYKRHPYFGRGSPMGYSIRGVQGATLRLKPGHRYVFSVNAEYRQLVGGGDGDGDMVRVTHPFYLTDNPRGGPTDSKNFKRYVDSGPVSNGQYVYVVPRDLKPGDDAPKYYACSHHEFMGGKIEYRFEPTAVTATTTTTTTTDDSKSASSSSSN